MEKFNLTWSEFGECRSNAISDLLLDKDFTDVTLVCEDNKQIATHKLIISSCSLFFKNIFKNNPHQNPIIYLKGVKFVHLQSMLKFIPKHSRKHQPLLISLSYAILGSSHGESFINNCNN